MKAYTITLKDHNFSERKATECIQSARDVGNLKVEKFYGVDKEHSRDVMKEHGLKWTWARNNTIQTVCAKTGLIQTPYHNASLSSKIGCSMSHYLLWKRCVELNEPMLILEHDAVFVRELPEVDFKGICQINDPKGGGKNGKRLSESMKRRSTKGVHPKTQNTTDQRIPDGLAGNSAYLIKPFAAQELINKYHELGVWPNDATICIQFFPYLEEYYPFITIVNHENTSTSST